MSKEEFREIVEEVVKIYFDYNCSVKEAIEKAKEVISCKSK